VMMGIKNLVLPDRIFNLRHIMCADETRRRIGGIHITRTFAEATDGHALVRIDFTAAEKTCMAEHHGMPPEDGCILRPTSTAKPKRKKNSGFHKLGGTTRRPIDDMMILLPAGNHWLVDGERAATFKIIHNDFPDTSKVIEPCTGPDYREIGITLSLLDHCAKASGSKYDGAAIHVHKSEPLSPYKVTGLSKASGITCIIMPRRVD